MYEGDAPLAERRAAALSLDRDLLRELLGAEELRELLDPGVLADVELELQCLTDGRRARTADELHDVLRRVGDLAPAEVDLRCEGDGTAMLAELVAERRAIELRRRRRGSRCVAADDAARYRDALGCSLPLGLPTAFTDPVPRPLEELVARFARTHGPFLANDVARRFGAPLERVEGAIAGAGRRRAPGARRVPPRRRAARVVRPRRAAPASAALAGHVAPRDRAGRARGAGPVPSGVARHRRRPARSRSAGRRASGVLAGAPLVASTIERDLLPARVAGYRPATLDELCTSGEVVWLGAGSIGQRDGRVRLCFADQVASAGTRLGAARSPGRPAPRGDPRPCWPRPGPASGASCGPPTRAPPTPSCWRALWDLVWAGEVTNDSLAPLRAVLAGGDHGAAAARRAGRARQRAAARAAWRGSARLPAPAAGASWRRSSQPAPSATEAAHAQALQLLERHGVVTREAVLAEGVVGGYASVYGVLKVLEERGRAPARLLRRRARRGPVRAAGRGRSAALRARAGRGRRGRRCSCSPPPIRRSPTGRRWRGRRDDPAQRARRRARRRRSWSRPAACRWCGSTAAPTISSCSRRRRRRPALGDGARRPGAQRAPSAASRCARSTASRCRAEVGDALRAAGFVDGYRGLVLRGLAVRRRCQTASSVSASDDAVDVRLRPPDLAAYSARSAVSSVAADVVRRGRRRRRPTRSRGCRRGARSSGRRRRSGRRSSGRRACDASGSRMQNSSPP